MDGTKCFQSVGLSRAHGCWLGTSYWLQGTDLWAKGEASKRQRVQPKGQLMHNTGSSTQCSVTTQCGGYGMRVEGGSRGRGHMYTYGWFMLLYYYWKSVWVLAACCSKANKQARLVERKVCFISDAGNWSRGRVADVCPKVTTPQCPTHQQAQGWELLKTGVGEGATCRNSTVISNSHLQIGHQ